MTAAPSPAPTRYPQGVATDPPYGPLAFFGEPNPFTWGSVRDDFIDSLAVASRWTKTTSGNGSIANAAGDGGRALFTTNTGTPLVSDVASIQNVAASFSYSAGKKFVFLTRLQVSDALNCAFIAGLIQTTTTPFTVADGIYFLKASGATTLSLVATIGGVSTTIAIPTASQILANATDIDLGFYISGALGDIRAFVGSQLVGYIPQSGSSSQTPPTRGAVARGTGITYTGANLNVTLALQSGTASSKTLNADFILAAKER